MKKRYLIPVILCLILLIGCQSNNSTNSTTLYPPTPNYEFPIPDAVQNEANKTPPPKQIEIIESDSEDIIDDITNKDWAKAQAKIQELKTSLNELIPLSQSAMVSKNLIDSIQASLAELEKQIANKQVYLSKVQANAITKYIIDIADYYQTPLPTDLGRLDFLGREILLNVENKDWPSARNNINMSKMIWSRLKLQLDSAYKNDVDQFNQSVNSLANYINQKDAALTNKEATLLLEQVDALEKDFSDQKK